MLIDRIKRLPSFLLAFIVLHSMQAWASESPTEIPVQFIPLAPPLDQPEAEISGMTWCGERLILVPQYPKRLAKKHTSLRGSYFYSLDKQQILNFLDGKSSAPLHAKPIRVRERSLRARTLVFDGYEGASCEGNQLWLTVESESVSHKFRGFLVPASLIEKNGETTISVQSKRIIKLGSQSKLINKGDEATTIWGQSVISFHEVNSMRHVKRPVAQVFNRKLRTRSYLTFPDFPFRLTDVSSVDSEGRFWAINYRYDGDDFSSLEDDKLSLVYAKGPSHQNSESVERLVEFVIDNGKISLVDQAPLQLHLSGKEGRNWEALARLDDRGLLIATDKHPATLFGFVPYP